jgi:hypothetical protein
MLAGVTKKKRITAPYDVAGGGGLPPWKIVALCPMWAPAAHKKANLTQPQICPAHGERLNA